MINVFNSMSVTPVLSGGSVIDWGLHPLFRAPAPLTFNVEWSRSGVTGAGDWLPVGQVIASSFVPGARYTLTDTTRRLWSNSDRLNYRVRLVASDNQQFVSPVEGMYGRLTRHLSIYAKEILRKEFIRSKGLGSCGLLFRRKDWGVRCTTNRCVDNDTNQVTNPHCPVCYGTGYAGGYFTPVDYGIQVIKKDPRRIRTEEASGQTDNVVKWARTTACPMPRTGDFWLEKNTDRRWYVQTVEEKSAIQGYPLILNVELRLAQPTEIIYAIDGSHVG